MATWEEAVNDLRSNPANDKAILDNYFENDILGSAERFYHSEEFAALSKLIPFRTGQALDIGAGRGIASYGLAKLGLTVTALEPDPSHDVGSGAIRKIASDSNLPIETIESFGEQLPFADNTFDLVYVRQVLHHANDLTAFCREVFRVLKPGGLFIATREHVLSKEEDLQTFLNNHPLHHLYGGENAFTLNYYLNCIKQSGLIVRNVFHPFSSVINYAPVSEIEMKRNFARRISKFTGLGIASMLMQSPLIYKILADLKSESDHTPGRLYSFVAIKTLV